MGCKLSAISLQCLNNEQQIIFGKWWSSPQDEKKLFCKLIINKFIPNFHHKTELIRGKMLSRISINFKLCRFQRIINCTYEFYEDVFIPTVFHFTPSHNENNGRKFYKIEFSLLRWQHFLFNFAAFIRTLNVP